MQVLTGQDKADAGPMIEYFQPLLDWLKQQNDGQKLGWTVAGNPLLAKSH
jgi:peptidyl-dipeptidase A